MQQDRRADRKQSQTDSSKERTSVLVPERGIRFPETCFPDLAVLLGPPVCSPSYTHTHSHGHTLLKSHYISQEIKAFGKLSLVPQGYSQTYTRVTPPRSRVQLHNVGLSLLRQTPLSSKMLHNHPQRTQSVLLEFCSYQFPSILILLEEKMTINKGKSIA